MKSGTEDPGEPVGLFMQPGTMHCAIFDLHDDWTTTMCTHNQWKVSSLGERTFPAVARAHRFEDALETLEADLPGLHALATPEVGQHWIVTSSSLIIVTSSALASCGRLL
jgi:hypothetical protein